MTPLLARLEEECPGVQIDLIVDKEFSEVAQLLPRLRHVWVYDFQALMDDSRVRARDVVALHHDLAQWAQPLLAVGYDRVINLTFNRRSAFLAKFFGCHDERGMTTAPDGSFVVKNPWMKYFLDFQVYRHLNRFNIVDLFSLGGSGPGTFHPLHVHIQRENQDWAQSFLQRSGCPTAWVGVQVGASDPMKAWRPEYFGRVMARLSQGRKIGFVLIGSQKEAAQVKEAHQVYQSLKGDGLVCEAVGRTSISNLVALLGQCRLMITNDTGPMHIAVGVNTPVLNLSVGHVDFWETGPYGPGNWVIQPQISCGPCGFDMVCSHHACKDLIEPQEIASLCAWILDFGDFPTFASRVRVYEGNIDQDHLGTYTLRSGNANPVWEWYSKHWRRYWYGTHCSQTSRTDHLTTPPPDFYEAQHVWRHLQPLTEALFRQAQHMMEVSQHTPVPVEKIKNLQHQLQSDTFTMQKWARSSLLFGPLSVALLRDTHCFESTTLRGMIQECVEAYQVFDERVQEAGRQIEEWKTCHQRRELYASTIG